MSDVKPPGPSLPAAIPSARTAAVRAAQRAFFDAAIGPPAVPAASSVVRNPPHPAPRPQAAGAASAPVEPGRLLRPGSLLDIKV